MGALGGLNCKKKVMKLFAKFFLLNTIDLEFHYVVIFEYICQVKMQLNQ